jgi:hypothetical protein
LNVAQETRQAFLDSGVPAPITAEAASTEALPTPSNLTDDETNLLHQLQRLLRESDMGVFDLMDQLISTSPDGSSRWAVLENAVESMEFDRAMSFIEMTLKQH